MNIKYVGFKYLLINNSNAIEIIKDKYKWKCTQKDKLNSLIWYVGPPITLKIFDTQYRIMIPDDVSYNDDAKNINILATKIYHKLFPNVKCPEVYGNIIIYKEGKNKNILSLNKKDIKFLTSLIGD